MVVVCRIPGVKAAPTSLASACHPSCHEGTGHRAIEQRGTKLRRRLAHGRHPACAGGAGGRAVDLQRHHWSSGAPMLARWLCNGARLLQGACAEWSCAWPLRTVGRWPPWRAAHWLHSTPGRRGHGGADVARIFARAAAPVTPGTCGSP